MGDTELRHRFLLFVSGMSSRSFHAVENLRVLCDRYLPGRYDIEVFDISIDRELAVTHQIVAIPTLIRIHPGPRRVVVGDLSDAEKVTRILELDE